MDPSLRGGFELGEFAVFPLRNEIVGPHGSRHIAPKAMDVLCCLASRAPDVVERETVLEEVWGRTVIADDVLTRCISELRSALGDSASESRFVRTVPKRGYSLLIAPQPTAVDASEPARNAVSLWEELKQRSVFRVGMAYAAVAWLVIQLVETTFPYLNLPDTSIRFTVIAAIIGMPIVLVLAWVYEITPKGIVRDRGSRPPAPARFHRLDLLTISAVTIGVAFVVYQGVREADVVDAASSETTLTASPPPGRSIAILPFKDISESKDRVYFADGLAEDLIYLLTRVRDLRVSPRVASFYYKDKEGVIPVREIAAELQVDTILSGSVRIHDDTIIVIAELLDARTGTAAPPERIVRPLGDILDVQYSIAETVVRKLQIELGAESTFARQPTNPAQARAYGLFSQARELLRGPREPLSIDAAQGLLERALNLYPEYADAHAALCETHLARYALSNNSDADSYNQGRDECLTAQRLDAANPFVNVALGDLYYRSTRYDDAIAALNTAIEQSPFLVGAHIRLGMAYRQQGKMELADAALRHALDLDPSVSRVYQEMGNFLFADKKFLESADYYHIWTELTPTDASAFNNLAGAYFMMNDFERASAAYERSLGIRKNRSAYTNLGLSYYYGGRFEDAVAMQRAAIELEPEDHSLWGRLAESARFVDGLADESQDAYAKAIEFAEKRLGDAPNDRETRALLALYTAHIGANELAIEHLEQALDDGEGDAEARYLAALVHVELGDIDTAYDELDRSLSLGFPKNLVSADPDLKPLLAEDRFQALLAD